MTDYSKISAKIGHKHWLSSIIHDDGQFASDGGGKSTVYLASPGKGKSTLMCQAAEVSKFVYGSKHDFIKDFVAGEPLDSYKVFLETVIWRIRDFDAFGNLAPQNWLNSFKGWQASVKELHLWVHEDDLNIIFYAFNHKKQPMPVKNLPPVEYYKDADDLTRRLHWGAINAVLEPQSYHLSPLLIQKLREKKMDMDEETEQENEREELQNARRAEKRKPLKDRQRVSKKVHRGTTADYQHREVSPAYFWFDLIHTVLEANKTRHVHFCIDEWDDIAEARSEGDVWKLIDVLAQDWKTLRKSNISTHLSTHQTDYVDWRILKRIDYFIWMKGAIIHPSYSMLNAQHLVSNLPMGTFLIEEKKVSFGIETFDKIPYNQPNVRIDGLKGQSLRLTESQAKIILKTMCEA